jgi:hypothetical protein
MPLTRRGECDQYVRSRVKAAVIQCRWLFGLYGRRIRNQRGVLILSIIGLSE